MLVHWPDYGELLGAIFHTHRTLVAFYSQELMPQIKAPNTQSILPNKCYFIIIRRPDELITILKGVRPSTTDMICSTTSRHYARQILEHLMIMTYSMSRNNRPTTRTKLCNYWVIHAL